MAKVIVLTPTYNRASTIGAAIESVLRQSFSDFEHWILDDQSTDDTKKIMESFSDPRVKYFSLSHRGQSDVLNWGLLHAKSELIAFLDSDDEYLPDHLKELVSPFEADPSLDFVLGSFVFELPNGKKPSDFFVEDYYRPKKRISLDQIECICGALCGKTTRFIEAGGFKGVLSDIALFDAMKKKGFTWKKIHKKTYRYFFGRFSDSVSLKNLKKRN